MATSSSRAQNTTANFDLGALDEAECRDGERANPRNADYLILERRSAIAPCVTVAGH